MIASGTLAGGLRPTLGMPSLSSLLRLSIAAAAVLLAAGASAAEAGFSASLSPAERSQTGLSRLDPGQLAALDRMVAHDVTLARQGGVTAFSSDFAARHTPPERKAAGVDRLSPPELASLNALVAHTIASPPSLADTMAYEPPAPAEPMQEVAVTAPPKFSVHGDVSFTVGGGHGSSFYGTSADLFVTDPSGKFTLGVGVSDFHGKGLLGAYGPYCLPILDPAFPGW
jgi:hypothetical protein